MKILRDEKKEVLFQCGYGERAEKLAKNDYEGLSEEEKKRFTHKKGENWLYEYFSEENLPDYTEEEFDMIVKVENLRIQKEIENNLTVIKICVVVFAALTTISLLGNLILMSKMMG